MGSPRHRCEARNIIYQEARERKRDFRGVRPAERSNLSGDLRESQQQSPSPPLKRARTDYDLGQTSDKFVWKKKVEQLRKRGIRYTEEEERRHREDLQRELEDAKRRRERRDKERAEWEAEQNAAAREREAQLNEGWHRQEASFHGKQYFLRQAIRLRSGRPNSIDLLAQYVRLDLESDVGTLSIDDFCKDMDTKEFEKLSEGVEEELDYVADFTTETDNRVWNRAVRFEFWQCVKTCILDNLSGPRADGKSDTADGLHSAVEEDVDALLRGKSASKLREMETEIDEKLKRDEEGYAEVDFWTAALARIRKSIAVERLREISTLLTREREKRFEHERKEDFGVANRLTDVKRGDEDYAMKEAARDMGSDEENFADEVDVPQEIRRRQTPGYAWNDKYRPRKPRYFNRVYTGYNWTKYNRTHYDHDNPPPKTVQGYKFNIFYPDLIDPTKAPVFTVTKTENPDVAIITFKAGPPYEDVAFKIVNRPWERSHKRGYKCSFDRGILHLWFHFQRLRYRR